MTTAGTPLRVLFVCTGNTCRSPYLELRTRHLAGDALVAGSAGTHAVAGAPVSGTMAAELRDRGTEPGGFRSRPLTGALVDDADLVVTAEAAHVVHVRQRWPAAAGRVLTLARLAALVRSGDTDHLRGSDLAASYGVRSGPVDAAPDVADPYRRGPVAAAACAKTLDDLLAVVVPALTGTRK